MPRGDWASLDAVGSYEQRTVVGDSRLDACHPGELAVLIGRGEVDLANYLAQVGLHHLREDRSVMHVAFGRSVDEVKERYERNLFELTRLADPEQTEELQRQVTRQRMISAFEAEVGPERWEDNAEVLRTRLGFRPEVVLVDGYDWLAHSPIANAALLGAAKAFARRHQSQLWVAAAAEPQFANTQPQELPPPCAPCDELIDRALFLQPAGAGIKLRAIKEPSAELAAEPAGFAPDDKTPTPWIPNSTFTLLSGGAGGAEAEFGACAEEWSVTEVNFTFAGHARERNRGLVLLNDDELAQGAVSSMYLQARMNRNFPTAPLFRKTLKSIWHQVKTAGEIFIIGALRGDGTVQGGTGWAAELGRHFNKPVHVYDQERDEWFTWRDEAWIAENPPLISNRRFCGTGTRFLNDSGREAIRLLFERSFGPPPEHRAAE